MIYELLVDGFEEIEALTPVDILRRGGMEVQTVGVYGKRVTGAHGIIVETDILLEDVIWEQMDMLILPGGPGHFRISESAGAVRLIRLAAEKNCYLAAICASPSILGKLGLLKGKKATCFPGFEKDLTGAVHLPEQVVTDGKTVTGKGAGAAAEFGFTVLSLLTNPETAKTLSEEMQY